MKAVDIEPGIYISFKSGHLLHVERVYYWATRVCCEGTDCFSDVHMVARFDPIAEFENKGENIFAIVRK
jgi:hypothetical protein